ncbi:hypothetical protein pRL70135 (plasmid) [Rhizobium johnstonii 3841]|uniref:Uncharacterized protein n=1 Tax=Rhizobium johnstonii (strain DSM 114642 / LMG 32736 / 3841) TaxID=216596 RepID=Q1M9Q1_RHIJ3|nr:hypothetical protein pRL70135 [Rhizobium johnstonii 3841]
MNTARKSENYIATVTVHSWMSGGGLFISTTALRERWASGCSKLFALTGGPLETCTMTYDEKPALSELFAAPSHGHSRRVDPNGYKVGSIRAEVRRNQRSRQKILQQAMRRAQRHARRSNRPLEPISGIATPTLLAGILHQSPGRGGHEEWTGARLGN